LDDGRRVIECADGYDVPVRNADRAFFAAVVAVADKFGIDAGIYRRALSNLS
jgi:hypothetical protein